jgi:hypothetical protein
VNVLQLSGPLDARNSASQPDSIVPQQQDWPHNLTNGETRYTFPPYSLTVMRWE